MACIDSCGCLMLVQLSCTALSTRGLRMDCRCMMLSCCESWTADQKALHKQTGGCLKFCTCNLQTKTICPTLFAAESCACMYGLVKQALSCLPLSLLGVRRPYVFGWSCGSWGYIIDPSSCCDFMSKWRCLTCTHGSHIMIHAWTIDVMP